MSFNHIQFLGNNLPQRLRSAQGNLAEFRRQLPDLIAIMNSMESAGNFQEIENQFGLPSNGSTDTNSNGYKVLSYLSQVRDAFASDLDPAGTASDASHLKTKLDQLTVNLG
jgi:hypothetical protein